MEALDIIQSFMISVKNSYVILVLGPVSMVLCPFSWNTVSFFNNPFLGASILRLSKFSLSHILLLTPVLTLSKFV